MLAAWQDYVYPWQLPLLSAFVVGWVLGGGFLLRLGFRKHLPPRRTRLGRCVLASLAGGTAGAFAAAVFFVFMRTVAPSGRTLPSVPAVVLSVFGFIVLFYLVLYVMFDLPLGIVLKAGSPAVWATVVLGGAIAVGAALPARAQRLAEMHRQAAMDNLRTLHGAIAQFFADVGRSPKDLQEAIEKGYLDPADLRGTGGKAPLYLPAPLLPAKDRTERLLLCDRVASADGRPVAFASRVARVEWVSEERLRQLLAIEENAEFAKKLSEEPPG